MKSTKFLIPALIILIGVFYWLMQTPSIAVVEQNDKLPIIGQRDINPETGDTIYHKISDFEFINQDSQAVNNATFEDKVYVVDFFFISCPTICPKLTKQMLRIHDEFKDVNDVLLLSHTVDPKHDTIPRLKNYAENLGADATKWHFVTGDQDEIYEIAEEYFSVAIENPDAPGGYDHSGRIILIDKNRHVRSFCNGTDPGEVDGFMKDIKTLLAEK